MAAPNGPMALASQVKQGTNITVTVVLRGMGPSPFFVDGGTTFNSGDPTATYTIAVPSVTALATGAVVNGNHEQLCDILDSMAREGTATIS